MYRPLRLGFACVLVACSATAAWAQSREIATVRAGEDPRPASALLSRQARLAVQDVPLAAALTDLSKQSRVGVAFSPSLLPDDRIVSCACEAVTVGEALDRMLAGSGFSYVVHDDQVLIIPRPQPSLWRTTINYGLLANGGSQSAQSAASLAVRTLAERMLPQVGTIAGTVTEAGDGKPIVNAQVAVDGAGRAFTDGEGRYRITNVPSGRRSVSITSIGYRRATREVDVRDGLTATVDFALDVSPSQLDAVVVTVTGEQRARELGNVVGRINADSVVRGAPISNLGQLLTGRVAGLQVFQAQGTVGGQVQVQVRTPGSLLLNTEPIVVVDGARYTSQRGPRPPTGSGVANIEPSSPLNDINPNDIASIEVVKGPAAATLYGTDAANGVIVITTKRGERGPPRWNAYGRATTNGIPSFNFPDVYWAWHTVNGEASMTSTCHLRSVAAGSCAQDSVSVLPNPLNDSELAIFDNRPQWEYGASVSGGQQDLRYYLSGDFERAVGPLRMPPAIAEQLRRDRGVDGLPNDQLEPNALTRKNVRANVTMMLGDGAEVRANAGYTNRVTRSLNIVNPYVAGATRGTPLNPYGSPTSSTINGPEQVFSNTSTERVHRFFGSVGAQLQPRTWLMARATVGIDVTSSNRESLVRRGEAERWQHPTGAVGDERTGQTTATVEVGSTGLFRTARFSFRTSVGAQYVRLLSDALLSFGTDLPPGGSSIGEAANVTSRRAYRETATLGSYLEETVGLNDRLFVTGALRVDGASSFGQNYDATVYPKASISWLVSEEPAFPKLWGLDELRARYAFGASGQQPLPEWSRPGFIVQPAVYNGALTSVVGLTSLGNPDIRPERVKEHEIGFDMAALGNRAQLAVTWYRRKTVDQIQFQQLAPGLGSTYLNFGLTTGRGFEAQLTAAPVDTRAVSWQVSVLHSTSSTRLDDLGDAGPRRDVNGGWVEGFPLGARFMRPLLGYEDMNGDGIIAVSELQLGDTAVFVGESIPPRIQTLVTTVGLLQQRVRLSALLERKSGFTQVNSLLNDQCETGRCRAIVDPGTPLAEQALAAAASSTAPPGAGLAAWTFIEPGDFTRLREITAAVDLPTAVVGAVRMRSGTVSLSARNLALWTDFSGGDPESAFVSGIRGVNASGIPQARSYTIRLDLGF